MSDFGCDFEIEFFDLSIQSCYIEREDLIEKLESLQSYTFVYGMHAMILQFERYVGYFVGMWAKFCIWLRWF